MLLFVPIVAESQDLLYSENFATTSSWGRDEALGTPQTQWFGLRDGSTTNNDAAETFENWYAYNGYWAGPALNNSPAEPGDLGVFVFTISSVFRVVYFTREYSGISAEEIGTISWDMVSRGTGGAFNVILKVDGNWYTPASTFSLPTALLWTHFSVSLSSATWIRMDGMDPEGNSALEPASVIDRTGGTGVGALPAGPVQAFGIHFDNMTNGNVAIDNYRIYSEGDVAAPVAVGMAVAGEAAEISINSEAGHYYQLQVSVNDMASWDDLGYPQPGNGGTLILSDPAGKPASGEAVFYRVVVAL
jgi:hypothetical protein